MMGAKLCAEVHGAFVKVASSIPCIIISWKTTEFSRQTMMSAYSSVFVVFNLNRTKIPLLKKTLVKSRLF